MALGGARQSGLARGPLVALAALALLATAAVWPSSSCGTASPTSPAALDAAYAAWLPSFRAANPAHQAFCERALRQAEGAGEYAQDMFMFFNVFKHWPAAGRRGVYVDSGTNHPERMSNTLFFDRCLGWKGVCVEPQEKHWEAIAAKRSCTLVKGCLAARSGMARLAGGPDLRASVEMVGGAEGDAPGAVQCRPLEAVLAAAGVDPPAVDFWSLDVEGAEMGILEALNFTRVGVGALLVEDMWLPQRDLDRLLTTRGFVKVAQLPADSAWVPRGAALVEPAWTSSHSSAHWLKVERIRAQLAKAPPADNR